MPNFVGCKLEMKLEAQTPMIHFQAREEGATLRATEVKPKLDRYILKYICGRKPDRIEDVPEEYQSIISDKDHLSLKYKLRIYCEEPAETVDLERIRKQTDKRGNVRTDRRGNIKYDGYSIYYGNMKKSDDEKTLGLLSNPTVSIICLNSLLRELIEKHIVDFFLSTNFGTMQDKGFGSFLPLELGWSEPLSGQQQNMAANALKSRIGSAHCYKMEFQQGTQMIDIFTQIKDFYGIMKSGKNDVRRENGYVRSYLFQYLHDNFPGLNDEKAWMKNRNISPNIQRKTTGIPGSNTSTDQNSRYIRAFLGTAENLSYIKALDADDRPVGGRMPVHIESTDTDKIERVPSPLYFKVIKNCVFIAASQVDPDLYGRKFKFTGFKSGEITTLRQEDAPGGFDMDDFLSKYVAFYNSQDVRKKLGIGYYRRVVQVV